MDLHKPKSVNGWREFLSETAMIVVGVLIALSAEQAVEYLQTVSRIRSVETQMRWELSADDGPEAFIRDAMGSCVERSLDNIRALAESGASRAELLKAISIYDPPHFTWDENAYEAAHASGMESRMDAAASGKWAYVYSVVPRLDVADEREIEDSAGVRAISRTGGALTAEERTQVIRAAVSLTIDNRQVSHFAKWLVRAMDRLGVRLDATRARWAVRELETRPMAADCAAAGRAEIEVHMEK